MTALWRLMALAPGQDTPRETLGTGGTVYVDGRYGAERRRATLLAAAAAYLERRPTATVTGACLPGVPLSDPRRPYRDTVTFTPGERARLERVAACACRVAAQRWDRSADDARDAGDAERAAIFADAAETLRERGADRDTAAGLPTFRGIADRWHPERGAARTARNADAAERADADARRADR